MSRQFLVDGYNVMKKMPLWCDRTLEDGRAGLLRFIRERRPQGSGRNSITVVFDGQEGICSPQSCSDVRVVFTCGTSADDHIRVCVEDAADPRRIICVTDDRELATACAHRGAEVWGVDAFMAKGYKQAAAAQRAAVDRRRDGDGKAISDKAANRIDQELAAIWLRKKV